MAQDSDGRSHEAGELTVARLLDEPLLRARLIGGTQGLSRPISWCLPFSEIRGSDASAAAGVVQDLHSVAVHVQATLLARPDAAREVIEEVARGGAAVLLVRRAPEDGVDLASAARAADAVGLPLAQLPAEADYRSVGRLVAAKVLTDSAHVLEYGVRVHRMLGETFAAGSGLSALAYVMSVLARSSVLVFDADGEILAHAEHASAPLVGDKAHLGVSLRCWLAGPDLADSGQDVLVRGDGAADEELHTVASPVKIAGEVYGAVAILEPKGGASPHDHAQHRVIVEQGAPLVASEMLRQRSMREAEERARDDFLDSLVHDRFTDVHELAARSRHYHFDVNARHVVFVAEVPALGAGRSQHLLRSVYALAEPPADGFVLGAYVGGLLVVVRQLSGAGYAGMDTAAEVEEIRRFGRQLQRTVAQRLGVEVRVAYGRAAEGASGVSASYREARIAIELSHRVAVPPVCGYDQLRVFAAIKDLASSPQGRAFAQEVLDPLRRTDRQIGSLQEVVLAYIAESGNLNGAARRLNLHRNTMLYKIERASRALRMDVRQSETQFMVWLAHHIDILNDSQGVLDRERMPPV
jgi:sugar diacid utilization regulator